LSLDLASSVPDGGISLTAHLRARGAARVTMALAMLPRLGSLPLPHAQAPALVRDALGAC